jgi:alkylation response protein AidB-like acyl-CoA dehydrogenase
MPKPLKEHFENLEFSTPEKASRYKTENYQGAVGKNWYLIDPSLKFLMRYYLGEEALELVEPKLIELGELMGTRVAKRAEITDKNPPKLVKYDKWGHDISEVVMPVSFYESRKEILENNFMSPTFAKEIKEKNINPLPLGAAWSYMLDQAEIGMACALGTGGNMVINLARDYAPKEIADKVEELFAAGEMAGEAAQMLTERSGGSDLSAIETTAVKKDSKWYLNGFKWFVSNANGSAFIALAKVENSSDDKFGIAPFLILWEKQDGTRNGIKIRRLKDKLGTTAVASAEIELNDAEAYMLAPDISESDTTGSNQSQIDKSTASDGKGLSRMMQLTNSSRLGIAMMGLGVARRSLTEALLYCNSREAFSKKLDEQPLMQRQLSDLIVEVEACQALVFEGFIGPKIRIGAPLIKLRAARLGIEAASTALEIHGGNGYIEDWPIARLVRDSQVNTVWEGASNILYLDILRGILRNNAHEEFFGRITSLTNDNTAGEQLNLTHEKLFEVVRVLGNKIADFPKDSPENIVFTFSELSIDLYILSLLMDQITKSLTDFDRNRKTLLANLYCKKHLMNFWTEFNFQKYTQLLLEGTKDEIGGFKYLKDGTIEIK